MEEKHLYNGGNEIDLVLLRRAVKTVEEGCYVMLVLA